jgi:cysteine desulfurase/selenocysteine lyase
MTQHAMGPGSLDTDVERIREEFPALHQKVHGKPLVWLDNAATTQKPYAVIDSMNRFYSEDNANVHRGVHALSERSTRAFEAARERVGKFLNAAETREIILLRGTTEAINLVANAWGTKNLREGDEIVISGMEHHADIVPWQMACERTGALLRVIPLNERGELILEEAEKIIGPKTKLVGCVHVSNALGTVNPVKEIAKLAHAQGALMLVDGAQATAHVPVDVRDIDADFYAFSGHKVYGPTGVGALYGKAAILEAMPPWMGGGDMIRSVTFEKTTYAGIPAKFEAGTPNVAGVIGLGAALEWYTAHDRAEVWAREDELLRYGTQKLLEEVPGLRMVGTAAHKVAVMSFVIDGVHPHDLGTILDRQGVAIRTGHHCAQPVMQFFRIPATARASLGIYNSKEDVDRLVEALKHAVKVMR